MKSEYVKNIRDKIGHEPMFMPTVGLIIYKNGKILLQKRSDDSKWAIHGGGMELGEKYIDTLIREIKEEINVKPINPQLYGIFSGSDTYHKYTNGDKVYIVSHIFICEDYEGNIKFNDGEVKQFKWFDIDNLPKDELMDTNIYYLKDLKLFIKNRKPLIN